MIALAHDILVAIVLLAGLWAVCTLTREELDRVQRARRIFRGWRRG